MRAQAEARRISRHFVDRSLAQRDGADESIRLHDLQLDYVRAQYPDHDALDLIHGAIRLSSHVIARDPGQFTSQMIGTAATASGHARNQTFFGQSCRGYAHTLVPRTTV